MPIRPIVFAGPEQGLCSDQLDAVPALHEIPSCTSGYQNEKDNPPVIGKAAGWCAWHWGRGLRQGIGRDKKHRANECRE